MAKPKNKQVKCEFCDKPIKFEHLGVVVGTQDKEVWVCDNIVCLAQAQEKYNLS